MLPLVELLAILYILSIGFAFIFKNRVEKMLPLSVMLIILLTYISGFFRNLKLGFYSVLIIALLFLIYSVYYVIKNKKEALKYVSPYALYYVVFAAWLYVRFSGRMLNEWDEFTHWGFTAKVMYESNMFSNEPGSTIYFVDYLPGTSLFQYFAMQFAGGLREDMMSIAQGLMMFSFIMPILGDLKWGKKHVLTSMLILFTAYIIPMGFYSNVYSSLYVDAMLAVIFAYVVFQCMKEEKYDLFFYVKISLACGTLCITKPSGIGLMAILAIVVFVDNFAKGRYKGMLKDKKYLVLVFDIIPFVIGFIYKKIWAIRLDKLGYSAHFDTNRITIDGIIEVFSGGGQEYQQTTLKNFYDSFIGSNYVMFNFSSLAAYIFLFVAIVLVVYLVIGDRKRCIILGISTSAVYLLYSFYMLLLYLFTYSANEAVALASFVRYEYTIILGIVLGLVLWLLYILMNQEKNRNATLLVIVMSMFFILPEGTVVQLMNRGEIDISVNMRQSFAFADVVRDELTEDDKVYVISQSSNGFEYFVLRYTLSPVHTQTRLPNQGWWDVSWNIGQENGQGLNRRVITDKEWIDYLVDEEFDYVLLHNIDEQFVDEFGGLFDQIPKSNQLYKVDYSNNRLLYYEVN